MPGGNRKRVTGSPHDAMDPLHRLVRWMEDDDIGADQHDLALGGEFGG
jgi:hypothetical protein